MFVCLLLKCVCVAPVYMRVPTENEKLLLGQMKAPMLPKYGMRYPLKSLGSDKREEVKEASQDR